MIGLAKKIPQFKEKGFVNIGWVWYTSTALKVAKAQRLRGILFMKGKMLGSTLKQRQVEVLLMFTRITRLFAFVAILTASAQSGYGAFISDVSLSSNLSAPNNVLGGTAVEIMVACSQSYNTTNPGNDISRIQLNWTDSSAGLTLTAGSTWTWDSATSSLNFTDDADMSDGIVNRQGAGAAIAPSSPFTIGVLSFLAPAYNEGGVNTYVLNLIGGSESNGSCSAVADGTTYLTPKSLGGMTVGDFSFTVVPEPASTLLLGVGGLTLLRRKRQAG